MANTTTPNDENLDPIKSCGIPQTVTQLKALLRATQQMAQYVPYYALVAAPLHKLTRKDHTLTLTITITITITKKRPDKTRQDKTSQDIHNAI